MNDLQIFSVDDHILEPPHTWQSRLPERYREVGPRIVQADMTDAATRGRLVGMMDLSGELPDRLECWAYEDRLMPIGGLSAALARRRRQRRRVLEGADRVC